MWPGEHVVSKLETEPRHGSLALHRGVRRGGAGRKLHRRRPAARHVEGDGDQARGLARAVARRHAPESHHQACWSHRGGRAGARPRQASARGLRGDWSRRARPDPEAARDRPRRHAAFVRNPPSAAAGGAVHGALPRDPDPAAARRRQRRPDRAGPGLVSAHRTGARGHRVCCACAHQGAAGAGGVEGVSAAAGLAAIAGRSGRPQLSRSFAEIADQYLAVHLGRRRGVRARAWHRLLEFRRGAQAGGVARTRHLDAPDLHGVG